jgi:hypothetical protein
MAIDRPFDLEDICRDIALQLNIPERCIDAAIQEGFFAYRENRDIEEALRYWWEAEQITS